MCRVTGRALAKIAASEQQRARLSNWVASSPGAALRRLEIVFGVAPTPSGSNIEGILQLREALYDACRDAPEVLHSFLIVAPHTHWGAETPVVLSREAAGYRIGPASLNGEELYTPISFAFTPEGICAYEWADASIEFSSIELHRVYHVIRAVHEKFADNNWPLGISLNCRFKELLEPPVEATLEYSGDDPKNDSSAIYLLSKFKNQSEHRNYAQVGWHPYSDHCYDLAPKLTQQLKSLRNISENLSDSDRAQLRDLLRDLE